MKSYSKKTLQQLSTNQTRKVDKFRGKVHHEKAETCRPNKIFITILSVHYSQRS